MEKHFVNICKNLLNFLANTSITTHVLPIQILHIYFSQFSLNLKLDFAIEFIAEV